MNDDFYKSEIRDSTIRELIEKVKKQNYKTYLRSVRLENVRQFKGSQISFDFPVTALIGPNGSGKSTVLGVSSCIYAGVKPQSLFKKSRIGDEGMDSWKIEYEVIDKAHNRTGSLRADVLFKDNAWQRDVVFERDVRFFSINRTVPASENSLFLHRRRLSSHGDSKRTISTEEVANIDHIKREAERVLGRSLSDFKLLNIKFTWVEKGIPSEKVRLRWLAALQDGSKVNVKSTLRAVASDHTVHETTQLMYVGSTGGQQYSEFNFGSGESSIIRMISDIESMEDFSLVLIEEIENGLHPLAVRRMVEYLIEVAKRKNIQVIFTTHSDYALASLPSEAIWAVIDGRLQQGKLSIEALRSVSGRIDKRLAIFVEDRFAMLWVEAVIREKFGDRLDEIGVYPVQGDGNAVKTHLGHTLNPAVSFHSICFIDGDSQQAEDTGNRIYRLAGQMPESTIFNSTLNNIDANIVQLTLACQRPLSKQDAVLEVVKSVSHTNRDGHLLFSQVGLKLGLVPEATIQGAFLTLWIQDNADEVEKMVDAIEKSLNLPPKKIG